MTNGFGNMVLAFDGEAYAGQLSKFIEHLEKHVKKTLEEKLGFEVQAKILYFR
jgi:hypothetical protein